MIIIFANLVRTSVPIKGFRSMKNKAHRKATGEVEGGEYSDSDGAEYEY